MRQTTNARLGTARRAVLVKRAVFVGARRLQQGAVEVITGRARWPEPVPLGRHERSYVYRAWWPELAPLTRQERSYVYGVLSRK